MKTISRRLRRTSALRGSMFLLLRILRDYIASSRILLMSSMITSLLASMFS